MRRLIHKPVALAGRQRRSSVPAGLRLPQPRPTGAFVNKPYHFPNSYLTSLLLNLTHTTKVNAPDQACGRKLRGIPLPKRGATRPRIASASLRDWAQTRLLVLTQGTPSWPSTEQLCKKRTEKTRKPVDQFRDVPMGDHPPTGVRPACRSNRESTFASHIVR